MTGIFKGRVQIEPSKTPLLVSSDPIHFLTLLNSGSLDGGRNAGLSFPGSMGAQRCQYVQCLEWQIILIVKSGWHWPYIYRHWE